MTLGPRARRRKAKAEARSKQPPKAHNTPPRNTSNDRTNTHSPTSPCHSPRATAPTTFADVFNIAGPSILQKLCPCCLKTDLSHLRLLNKQMAAIIDQNEVHSVQFNLNKKRPYNHYEDEDDYNEDECLIKNIPWNKITPNTLEEAVMLKEKWPSVKELIINALLSMDTQLVHHKTGPRRKGLRTLRLLVEAKAWPELDLLDLSGLRFDSGPDSIKLLQTMVVLWQNVKCLTIDNVVFTPATMKIFVGGWPHLETLKVLSYPFVWTRGTWDAFASQGKFNWKKLSTCVISAQWPRMDVLVHKAKWLRGVEVLSFEGTGLKILDKYSTAALGNFQNCRGFEKLEHLSFRRTNINAAALVSFFTAFGGNKNNTVTTSSNRSSHSTVKNPLLPPAAVPFANLSQLDLSLCPQPNLIPTLTSIIKDGHLPSLKTLVIHMSPVDDSPSPHMTTAIATQFFEAALPGQLELQVVPSGCILKSAEEYREMRMVFQQHVLGGLMGMWGGGFEDDDVDDEDSGDDWYDDEDSGDDWYDDEDHELWWDDSNDDDDDFNEDAFFDNLLNPQYQ